MPSLLQSAYALGVTCLARLDDIMTAHPRWVLVAWIVSLALTAWGA